jgi:hypothetical protein
LNRIEARKWCFEKAFQMMQFKQTTTDLAADLIYTASEIEIYLFNSKNPRRDFEGSVLAAIKEVERASIIGVGETTKIKVIERVKHWLRKYDIRVWD